MGIVKAKKLVKMLADGIDPTTGEILPPNSPYNDPEIIRALFSVLKSARAPAKTHKKTTEEKQNDNVNSGRPRNAGIPWTKEQKREVSSLSNQGKTIEELSEYFERTKGAIKSELEHQSLVDPESI